MKRPNLPPWPPKPTVRGPLGRLICRCGCGRETQPPRRSWASSECLLRTRMRCDWSVVRKHIYELHRGLCSECGCHPESLRAQTMEALADGNTAAVEAAKLAGWPRLSRVWFDIDHIKPVCEGGAGEGRANLRILCYRCHSVKTKALNQERRARGKPVPA